MIFNQSRCQIPAGSQLDTTPTHATHPKLALCFCQATSALDAMLDERVKSAAALKPLEPETNLAQ